MRLNVHAKINYELFELFNNQFEAQICGTPVIAFGKGGALETILCEKHGAVATGGFFGEQSVESIIESLIHLMI